MNLSPHFTAAELGVTSATPVAHVQALAALCLTILEPIREHVGRPVHVNRPDLWITSRGWRHPASLVGSRTSQHRKGEAADFDLGGADLVPVWRWIAWESGLPFGQVILEKSAPSRPWGWVHVSLGAPWRDPARCGQVLVYDGRTYRRLTGPDDLP